MCMYNGLEYWYYLDCSGVTQSFGGLSSSATTTFCGLSDSVTFTDGTGLVSEGLPCIDDGNGNYICGTSSTIEACNMIFNSNNGIYLSNISS